MTHSTYAAVVIDLDGTLIGRDEEVSPVVAEAVAELALIVPVCIASGREPSDVLRFAAQFGLEAPQVSDNGAVILDPISGRTLHSFPMPARPAEEIVRRLERLEISFIATHAGGTATAIGEIPSWDLARVSALDLDEAGADRVAAEFESAPDLHVVKASLPYNGLWAVDFTGVGIDKGTALRRVAEMLGTETERMVAIGDSYNDISMLRECGLAIAMGDSPQEVRAVADYLAPIVDEDGLAVAIRQFVLPRIRERAGRG
ncbi:MAG: HAD family hydrolase [Chloroflexi bacterium]|nr:HAD family hydrolase [Chloroflexota bacterium]